MEDRSASTVQGRGHGSLPAEIVRPGTIHQLFERQAALTPEAVAVVCGVEQLSFAALARRAHALAGRLAGSGAGPEARVAICVERGVEMVAALLAIWKAGAAYVPLDPALPAERLAFMLEDSGARILVTEKRLAARQTAIARLVSDHSGSTILLDGQAGTEAASRAAARRDNLAYVMYTSGSTGRPKGVQISHRNVAGFLEAMRLEPGLFASDALLAVTTLSFDISVLEIFLPLLTGARLVIATRAVSADGARLARRIAAERITVMQATPATWQLLVAADFRDPGLKVICGGEALPPPLADELRARGGELWNAYGPTEATVWATVARVAAGPVPIDLGRALASARVEVLDARLRPARRGEVGELCLGGVALARGYLHRPRRTAASFVPDPFAGEAGARLYKTGDQVRFDGDGRLLFLGRIDHQVKLRGFRVELGEIEARLLQHPRVSECVVALREDRPGQPMLVAYAVAAGEQAPPADELRRLLGRTLPDYMIPARFVFLDALPLTANLKVDRGALPAPRRKRRVVAPRTPLEQKLSGLWRRVLELEHEVGVDEAFLELGGDSIRGALLVNRLQERLGEAVFVTALFDAPTVAEMAAYLVRHYDHAEEKLCGGEVAGQPLRGDAAEPPVGPRQVARLRRLITPLAPRPEPPARKNPRAVFVLAPPRSGSTLFRIMLGGHPDLFAPPELELLSFNTLGERRAACSGRYGLMREGLLRALMEIDDCSPEAAERTMTGYEARNLTVRRFYGELQQRLGPRMLVDKTTTYGQDPEVLRRAEADFEQPLYLHLVRHPCAVVHSFRQARIDRMFRFEHPFSARQLAELLWLVSHENIRAFLAGVPPHRQHRVAFEDLVRHPEDVLGEASRFLGLELHPDMLDPYRHPRRRMTDGLYAESRMVGDDKFRRHRKIDPAVAGRWRGHEAPETLAAETRGLASSLGYPDLAAKVVIAVPRPPAGAAPLSFAQRRLWFLDQLGAGVAYNTFRAFRLAGELEPPALAAGLRWIVRRHEVLRTSFPASSGEPRQAIAGAYEPPLPVVDLSALRPAASEGAARRLLAAVSRRPFDLARGPLLRALLIRLAGPEEKRAEHLLLVAIHHVVTDGWSWEVLQRELAAGYLAALAAGAPALPVPPWQYADFARWQHRHLSDEVRTAELGYWRTQLAGLPALALPTDRSRPANATYDGASVDFALPASLGAPLRALGRRSDATLAMTLSAAFKVLLGRHAQQRDVAVGWPIAGRNRRELENLIGFFVNTLVLRTDLAGDPTFAGLVGRERRVALAAYQHQELPFELLVEELSPERDPSRNPLFQVSFALQHVAPHTLRIPGLDVSSLPLDVAHARMDLELFLAEGPEAFTCRLVYNTGLFDASTAARLARHFARLLASAAADPGARISELALLGPAERHQLEVEWKGAERPVAEVCLHDLIAARARAEPERVAVVFEGPAPRGAGGGTGTTQLSYRQLDARADRLAHRLRSLGISAGDRVALCLPRGVEMVAGLLGILKSGGAYLPLDPALPAERLELMFQDAGSSVLLTERRLAESMPAVTRLCDLAGGSLLFLDDPSSPAARGPVPAVAGPDHLAYVIYTSGSTGRPKGVEVTHRNVVSFLTSMAREPGLSASDVLLAVTTLSFDIAALELFGPLATGGRLVIATRSATADGQRIAELLAAERASVMQATPATWQLLLQAGWRGTPELKMLCGGEALPRALAGELLDRGAELWNLYGPTETTIWSAISRISSPSAPVTIGRPILNTGAYVIDRRLRPVPRGAAGELYLDGAGVARGYHQRPRWTAEHFIPDPFPGASAGRRLYRTGDQARFDARGRLLCLGRIDHQIKLRGFRIEPGEIEAVLEKHPAVERAVVLLLGEAMKDRRLVACMSVAGGESLAAAELRGFLRNALPDYMVPSAFVPLGSFPLTPSGKIDRPALGRSLSDRAMPGEGERSAAAVPSDPFEEAVATAFAEVLECRPVGARDHFFDLGGHSLLATQLLSRLRDVLRVDLPLSAVFDRPTVAALAARARDQRRGQAASRIAPIEPIPRDGGLPLEAGPLSLAQRRLWILDQLGAGPAYNMRLAVEIEGEPRTGALFEGLRRIVARHEALRSTFPATGGKPRQAVSRQVRLPVVVVDLRALSAAGRPRMVQRLALDLERRPFDLARGPVLRLVLARLSRRRHILLAIFHHIVFDGPSMGLFLRELAAQYEALISGRPRLPELPVQYLDFAAWQRDRLRGEMLERELAFWREQLGAGGRELPVVQLPADRPRPPVQGHRGGSWFFRLSPERSAELSALSRQQGVTLAMLLLAAFKVLLARVTGQRDLIVGSPIAQRYRSELEALIGFFANTLVLRTDLSGPDGGPAFSECLRRVQEVALAAYDHQEMPFDLLVDELELERDLSRNPVFQIAFAWQHAASQAAEVQDLSLRLYPLETAVARMDLELFLVEHSDGLAGRLVYSADLFDATTVRRMAGHFQNLLESLLADPGAEIGDLALLGGAERHQLTAEWIDTERPLAEACLHELIAAQAQATPDSVAVIFDRQAAPDGGAAGDPQLSYRELDARAGRVAGALQARGIGADDRVALCLPRGAEMIVALLGILKAGSAYVPLDPDYPRERLAFMLRDCRARVLVTEETLLAGLPDHGASVLCLDRDRELIASAPAPRPVTTPENLAYVIYTSGSTGRPKGTQLAHRGLASLSEEQRQAFGAGPNSRVLQFSSLSFDASTFEIVMALAKGATLVLGSRQGLLPGPDLAAFLGRQRVSIVTLPPAALAATPPAALPALATITVAGEACPAELPARWAPGRRFFNLYGPTEATIWSTMVELESDLSPSIGRPIANLGAYLLDSDLRPVPIGVSAELYLGGRPLARGYLQRPALTAERFIPAPRFSDSRISRRSPHGPGARLYRTGDLARYRPDGEIEFLGRVDHQVKLRGYRIELGEIESVLGSHPGVRESAVMLRGDGSTDPRLVAYVVEVGGRRSGRLVPQLRRLAQERLPAYMVPSRFVVLDRLPVTPTGKVDRRALPAADRAPGAELAGDRQVGERYVAPRSEVEAQIAAIWGEVLGVEEVGVHDNFFDLGGHSLLLVQVQARLHRDLDCELSMTDLFQHPTVMAIAERLRGEAPAPLIRTARAHPAARGENARGAVAVIAMAGRFPGAADPEALWANVEAGVESIRFFTDQELRAAGIDEATLRDPSYLKARGALDGVELFDARLFGYAPREAELIDPQQRIFLETAWQALERAGYDPDRFDGSIGVYAGASSNDYLANVRSHPELFAAARRQAMLSNDRDYLPTRVSYKLDLRGPSVNVQTACSTSLVAVHEACRALLDRQCDMALAGGASVSVPAAGGYFYREGDINSPDGHCRTFDARAQGTLRSDGAGIVVLKRLDDALRDGDSVHAVILGTAINNDGANKVGFTAPGVEGQAEAIAMAQAAAGVDPETITYVEAHGTATPLGDPVEVAALTRVFREHTDRTGFCGLSALKSNVGHLDATAGVAGLIKAVLALEHRTLPPSLHFESPNPEIDFASSPFYVITEACDWQVEDGMPRRAGVSSFGLGGTNAHAVLEEAPALSPSAPSQGWQLLVLSAKSEEALDAQGSDLARYLRAHPSAHLGDVAYTLQVGRRELECRRTVRCRDVAEAIAGLAGEEWQLVSDGRVAAKARPVAFMFPGQGAQDVDMGVELYRRPGIFRDAVDACLAVADGELGLGLREVLYPEGSPGAGELEALRERLRRTSMAQPALFTVSYALARQWMAWGIEPESMIGHSIGEYVAACLAGVLSLEDALRLVTLRGRLMGAMPPGAMTAVPLPAGEVETLLAGEGGEGLWLSVVNAPAMCVVSGAPERLAAFESRLAASGTECRRLHTSHAFHSGLMDGAAQAFAARVGGVTLGAPRIPYASNVTGDWITGSQVRDPAYWGRQIRHPVRFAEGMERILADPGRVLLEVGPGTTLQGLAKLQESFASDRVVASSLGRAGSGEPATPAMTAALGRLWVGGVAVDWARVHGDARRRRVTLPTYPFERQRYWIDPAPAGALKPATERRADLADWFYVPVWRRSTGAGEPGAETGDEAKSILVFGGETELGRRVARGLERSGRRVISVSAGARFDRVDRRYTIEAGVGEHYARLLAEFERAGGLPGDVVHLWSVTFDSRRPSEAEAATIHERGLGSLLHLARALGEAEITGPVRISVVTDGVHQVLGDEAICPEKATVLGACRIMPLEIPGVDCRHVDLAAEPEAESARADRLVHEILSPSDEPAVAFRRGRRWAQALAPIRLEAVAGALPRRLRRRGVYLVTGGLGGMGLEVASELARTLEARLVLAGRTGLPERGEWAAREGEDDRARQAIRAIEGMEAAGAEVLVARADVCDLQAMRAVVEAAAERFGAIHGVFHLAADLAPGIIMNTEPTDRGADPKVNGTRVLEQLFGDRELDFLILASSLITWSGIPGRVAYCAASAYLDAFARRFGADTGSLTLAVDWTTWSETGLAFRAARARGQEIREGITSREGVEIFRRLLDRCDEPQILVSEVDPRDLSSPRTDAAGTPPPAMPEATPKHERPPLSTELVAARDDTEGRLLSIWQDLLGIEGLGIRDNYLELGGDSVLGIRIASAAREAGIVFTVRDLLEQQTVAALAAASATATAFDAEQGPVTGPLPLTPGQCWFFEQDLADPHHCNQAALLEIEEPVEPELLTAALEAVLGHHDALRFRFRNAGEWQAEIAPPGDPISLEIIDLGGTPPEELAAVIDAHGSRIQSSLDLDGPIVRTALFRAGGEEPDRLLVAVHHLAVDVVSWRILLEDLARGLQRKDSERTAKLPSKTTSIRAWSEHLVEMAESAAVADAARAWCEMPWDEARPLPRDFRDGDNTVASAVRAAVTLTAEPTRKLLRDATDKLGARIDDILLAALAQAVSEWTGARGVAVNVEGLGREVLDQTVDVSRTVGWFTAIYPVLIEVGSTADLPALLAQAQERFTWCREQQLSYGLARYLGRDPSRAGELRSKASAEISFVYFGQVEWAEGTNDVFKRSRESAGSVQSPRALRQHLLEIDTAVSNGCFHARCRYSRNVHRDETILGLIEAFKSKLEDAIQGGESEAARLLKSTERYGWSEQDLTGVLEDIERLRE